MEPAQVYIRDIAAHVGQTVTLKGWLYNFRKSGKLRFLQVRDGTGTIQCIVFRKEVSEEVWEDAKQLTQESSLMVTGEVREDPRSPIGFELGVSDLTLVQRSEGYPITKKEHGVHFLMTQRHLWVRSRRQQAVLRIRHTVVKAIRDYLDDNGFVLFDAPIFTPNAVEGTSTLFGTEYFGSMVYLTQSGQLYQESGAMSFGKVYCFGPTFRAEKSKTRRHLTEFWMVEPEVAYADLDDVIDLCEDFTMAIVARVLENNRADLETLERDISKLEAIQKPFPRISYDDAVTRLNELGIDKEWGGDLGAEEETVLSKEYDSPLFVHRYPLAVKAFYMKSDPVDERLSMSVDMLAPEGYGEVIGAGQREDDLDVLLGKIEHHGLPQDVFEWYLDLRRYGSVPHSGFGMGLERTVTWMCGIHHLRETIPFPRLMDHKEP